MMPSVVNVLSAQPAGDLKLRLLFDDGTEQVVDFRPFFMSSTHPQLRAWMAQEKFLLYRIEYGELVWGDYELCFPIADLYRNRLVHESALAAAAWPTSTASDLMAQPLLVHPPRRNHPVPVSDQPERTGRLEGSGPRPLAELCGVPADIISTGPDCEETIVRRHPFD